MWRSDEGVGETAELVVVKCVHTPIVCACTYFTSVYLNTTEEGTSYFHYYIDVKRSIYRTTL